MEQIYKDRLMKLVQLLRDDANNPQGVQFDLDEWGSSNEVKDGVLPVSCGTTACAMGLAALSGVFKNEGLEYNFYPSSNDDADDPLNSGYIDVIYQGHVGMNAAANFFGISYYAAERLFSGAGYGLEDTTGASGELAVAKHIEDYVNKH